jgi:hypothetical protein
LLNVNMPLLAYQLFTGIPVPRASVSMENKLVWFDALPDIAVAVADIVAGRTNLRELRESYKGKRIDATFARDDWLPGVVLLGLAPYLFVKGGG